MPIDPKLESFDTLVGTWEIEATHPMFPPAVVHGTADRVARGRAIPPPALAYRRP
jgi:hypothetical protein